MDNANIVSLLMEINGSVGELKEAARNGERDRREMKKLLEDHVSVDLSVAKRVTSLEHSRTKLRGMVIAVSAIVSVSVGSITFWVKNLAWAHP